MGADSDRWSALGWAIAIHLLLFALITFGLSSRNPVVVSSAPIIQATAVSEEQVMEPQRRRLAEEAARNKRIAAEKRRVAEQKRQKALAKKRAAEKARLAAQEKKRKMEAERKAAAERRKAAEEEKKRAAEAKKKAEAEEAKKRKEAEERLKAQMAAEAARLEYEAKRLDSARLSRLQDQYVADIKNKVQRNWLRPPDSKGSVCSVIISQIPGGEIVGIRVTDCDGDVAFKLSVESAVQKSSPLPMPKEPELFQREIEFIFRPQH